MRKSALSATRVIVHIALAIPPATLLLAIYLDPENRFVSWRLLCVEFLFWGVMLKILLDWQKNRDPLKLLLAVYVYIFFYLRPATLIFFPQSAVLARHQFDLEMVEATLAYVAMGTWMLFLGTCVGRIDNAICQRKKILVPKSVSMRWFALAFCVWAIPLLGGFLTVFSCASIPWANYFQLFNNPMLWLIYSIGLFASLYKFQSRSFSIALCLVAVCAFAWTRTMAGSRGAGYQVILSILFLYLAIISIGSGPIEILRTRSKYVFVWAVLVFTASSMVLFSVGDHMRQNLFLGCAGNKVQDIEELVAVFRTTGSLNPSGTALRTVGNVAERLGAFDNSIDLIFHGDMYAEVISFDYYWRSILDGLIIGSLTGEETLRASIMLKKVYVPGIDRQQIIEYYHSDIFTIFGEYFILFGPFGGLVVLFLTGAIAAISMRGVASKLDNPIVALFATATFLYLWWNVVLQGFGLDSLFLDTVKCAAFCVAASIFWVSVTALVDAD